MSHPKHKEADEDYRHAFNVGSDARLRGASQSDNPYPWAEMDLRCAWRRGWHDVHVNWGLEALWPIRELVAVRKLA